MAAEDTMSFGNLFQRSTIILRLKKMFSYLKSRTPLVQPAISFHHQNIKRINPWIHIQTMSKFS